MRIAIIGLGFSGILTFHHLIEKISSASESIDVEIHLFEKEECDGGLAYGDKPQNEHIMNAPIIFSSAFDDDPEHLLRWLQTNKQDHKWDEYDYCPRKIYGEYLRAILENAKQKAVQYKINFERFNRELIDLRMYEKNSSEMYQLKFFDGKESDPYQQVILATGNNLPFRELSCLQGQNDSQYIRNIWEHGAMDKIKRDCVGKDVLIIGTALSGMDVLLSLNEAYSSGEEVNIGNVYIVSRHALFHGLQDPGFKPVEPKDILQEYKLVSGELDFVKIKQALNLLLQSSIENPLGFIVSSKDGIAKARILFNALWGQQKTEEEKSTFIKESGWVDSDYSFFEFAATGMPVTTGAIVAKFGMLNKLHVFPADINDVGFENGKFKVDLKYNELEQSNAESVQSITVDYIVNALGVNHDYQKARPRFYDNLERKQAVECQATTRKGISVNKNKQVLNPQRHTHYSGLFAIGPVIMGHVYILSQPMTFSKAQSVLEIRKQAASLAGFIAQERLNIIYKSASSRVGIAFFSEKKVTREALSHDPYAIHMTVGNTYLNDSQYGLAIYYYNELLKTSMLSKSLRAKTYYNLGVVFQALGKHDDARESYFQAKILVENGEVVGLNMADIFYNLGNTYLNSDFTLAEKFYKNAKKVYRDKGIFDEYLYASILCNLGIAMRNVERNKTNIEQRNKEVISDAVKYHKKAVEIFARLSETNDRYKEYLANAQDELGGTYLDWFEVSGALEQPHLVSQLDDAETLFMLSKNFYEEKKKSSQFNLKYLEYCINYIEGHIKKLAQLRNQISQPTNNEIKI